MRENAHKRTRVTNVKQLLYIGQLAKGSTSFDRMKALEELGYDVTCFDTSPYVAGGSPMGTVEHRLNIGPAVTRLNRDIEKVAALRRSASLVWIDKGKWLWPETLHALRRNIGAPIVHYTPDPQLASNQSRHFERCIPLYDHLITTKKFEVDGYRRLGARHVVLTHQSYDERRFRPVPPSPTYASDVTFIGHFEPHYGRCVATAGRSGATVRVWGPKWQRSTRFLRRACDASSPARDYGGRAIRSPLPPRSCAWAC